MDCSVKYACIMPQYELSPVFASVSGRGPFPAVVDMFGTGGGVIEFRAALLASRGFVTFHLAYFDYEDLTSSVYDLDFAYFKVS
jgi:hypothetical protein